MDRSRSASSKTTTKHRTLVDESPGLTEVTRQQRPSDRGSRSRVTPSLVELCAGLVSEPPGTAGVDRSDDPTVVTIQSVATRIVIPTAPAVMRLFGRVWSRRRSVHSTVFSVFTFTCPSALGFSQHPDQHCPERPVLLPVDQQFGEGTTLRVGPRTLRSGRPARGRGASGRGAARRGPARGRPGVDGAGARARRDAWHGDCAVARTAVAPQAIGRP